MKAPASKITLAFREPLLPVIVISKDRLFAATDSPSLAKALTDSISPEQASAIIHAVDSAGTEFWYVPERSILAPGLAVRKWTKKRIIELFNSSPNAKALGVTYSGGGLSNKSLGQVVNEVARLLIDSASAVPAAPRPRPGARLQDVLDGVDFVSSGQVTEHAAYLCRKTGQVYWDSENLDEPLPDDLDAAGRYIALPHKNELGLGKALAMRFAQEFIPESLGTAHAIFSRPGAYARFKELLERHGMLKQWYDFEAKAQEAAVRAWCEEQGIAIAG